MMGNNMIGTTELLSLTMALSTNSLLISSNSILLPRAISIHVWNELLAVRGKVIIVDLLS